MLNPSIMSWQTITLYQFQLIAKIRANSGDTVADVNSKVIAILLNITERQVDAMPMKWFIEQSKQLDFLDEPIPEVHPIQVVRINSRRYRFTYDIQAMHFARYIESKEFSKDFIGNMHKAAASMVEPYHKYLPVRLKYQSEMHSQYADDMRHCRFIDVYNSVVFFYPVFRDWMACSKDYLAAQVGVSRQEMTVLLKTLDGFIPSSKWRPLKG